MSRWSMSPARAGLSLAVIAALLGLNLWRWGGGTAPAPAPRSAGAVDALPALPELEMAEDLAGFSAPPARDLFGLDSAPPPPPPPPPAPAPAPEPPRPDPRAEALRAAETVLDNVSVIGFLSTAEGVLAVLQFEGAVINAFEGDTPVPGFRVSDVTIESITLRHRDLDLERTFGLGATQ